MLKQIFAVRLYLMRDEYLRSMDVDRGVFADPTPIEIIQMQRPANLTNHDYPASISLYALEVQEINPPESQVAVHWRLMTLTGVVPRSSPYFAFRRQSH